jgi:hypothetical protein
MKQFVILAWMLFFVTSAHADVYYVRADGRDSNNGLSPESAFASLDRFAEVARAGDTVYIGAGTYDTQARFNHSGTEEDPVSIIGDVNGTRVSQPGRVVLRNGGGSETIQVNNADHVLFVGLHFEGGRAAIRVDSSNSVQIDECSFEGSTERAIVVMNNGTVRVTNCDITSSGDGIDVVNGSATISDTRLYDLVNALEIQNSGSSIEARRVDIRRVTRGAYTSNGTLTLINVLIHDATEEGVRTQNNTTLLMVHCTLDNIDREGAKFRGTSTLYNNIFSNIGSHCMDRDGGKVTASHNLVFNRSRYRSDGFNSKEFEFDPMYTNPDAGDFTLQAGSEANDLGMDPSAYTRVDLGMSDRPSGAGYDLGVYESAPPPILYVRQRGDDGNDGLSPQNALRTIGEAIARSTRGGGEIYVGPGEYREALEIGFGTGANAGSGASSNPTRVIADIGGTHTLDDPGQVILDGNGTRARAIDIRNVDHWHFENFIIRNFTEYAIHTTNSGFTLVDSVVHVPSAFGIYAIVDSDVRVHGCRFVRTMASGHIAWLQPTRGVSDVDVEYTNNDATMRDALYLSTGFRRGEVGRGSGRERSNAQYTYGLILYGYRDRWGEIDVSNSQFSDMYLPIYVSGRNLRSPVRVMNNTIVGSMYSVYVYAYRGNSEVRLQNLIIDQCYYGLLAHARRGSSLRIGGILEHSIGYNMSAFGRSFEFDLITGDPAFYEPESGDFSLWSSSAAIDVGLSLHAPGSDIGGRSRPTDGDGDGIAQIDLGAYEQVHEGGRQRVRVVQWREVGAQESR